MKKILVSLVSEQTTPNILVANLIKPATYWFITTKRMEMEGRTSAIINALSLANNTIDECNIQKLSVNQDSFQDCISIMEGLIENIDDDVEYIVNITGGNKIMAIAALEVFRNVGQKVMIGYMPLGKNEFLQVYPNKKPLKTYPVNIKLSLQEYLAGYGFTVKNIDHESPGKQVSQHEELSGFILQYYEALKDTLAQLYKELKGPRNKGKKHYFLTISYDRVLHDLEMDFFSRLGFAIRQKSVSNNLNKKEIEYLTGGWFEDYVFNKVYQLVKENVLDDCTKSLTIASSTGSPNELDVAFMKDNVFYHIECKTLGNEKDQTIIRDEVYKKGAISSLLGKGPNRAYICTTQTHIRDAHLKKASDYGINILVIEQVRSLQNILRERFGYPE